MSEEKAEALRQISEIKSHLVDKQTFFPYNYKATYVWAILAAILTWIMIPMYEINVLQGTVVTFIFITIGFVIEGVLTKKINANYDIEDCTNRQRFIMKNFLVLSLFGIVLTLILASYKLYVVIFLLWLFLCSIGYFAVGFVLNIKGFSQMAQLNIVISIVLLGFAYFTDNLQGKSSYMTAIQIYLLLGLSILPSLVAWQQIKEGK